MVCRIKANSYKKVRISQELDAANFDLFLFHLKVFSVLYTTNDLEIRFKLCDFLQMLFWKEKKRTTKYRYIYKQRGKMSLLSEHL